MPGYLYFALEDLLPRFLMVFKIGARYVGLGGQTTYPLSSRVLVPLLGLAFNNAVLLIFCLLALVGIVARLSRAGLLKVSCASVKHLCVAAWFVLALCESSASGFRYLHYYLLVVPPLSLLASYFLVKMAVDIEVRCPTPRWLAHILPALAVLLALSVSVAQNSGYYTLYADYRRGKADREDFLLRGWSWIGPSLARGERLADYIQASTSPLDTLYSWPDDVQLYYLADRRCAIDVIWPINIEATGSYRRIFSAQTKYIIVGDGSDLPRVDWLDRELGRSYTLETVIQRQEIYRRAED